MHDTEDADDDTTSVGEPDEGGGHDETPPAACGINGSIGAHADPLSSAERVAQPDSRDHRPGPGRRALELGRGDRTVAPPIAHAER